MEVQIPNEEKVWSTNFDPGRPYPPTLIVIHATRGHGATLEEEYQGTINFTKAPNANSNSSAHYVVGPTRCCRMVHDYDRSWNARYLNARNLGAEVAQPASLPAFTNTEYSLTAQIVAGWCHEFAIPALHVTNENSRGIIGHDETAQGKGEDKSDPGSRWEWTPFMQRVAAELVKLQGPPPLDPWAGVGDGLAKAGKAHPEWGTPHWDARSPHYWDADSDEILKLTSGDWLIWRHYVGKWEHVHWG